MYISIEHTAGETDSDGAEVDEEVIEGDLELKLHIMGSKQLFTETYPQFLRLMFSFFRCGIPLFDNLGH